MRSRSYQRYQVDKTMKCACGGKAVYTRRYSGQIFCKKCFNNYFERKVHDTIRSQKMINRLDRVGIGISGGKDSTVLLSVLSKIAGKLEITLHPILIDEGITGYRLSGINAAEKTCKSLRLNLKMASIKDLAGSTLDELQELGDSKPCTYCGVLRRKLLNKEANEQKLDKLATGHNLDDEAQAIMMNYVAGDINRLHRLKGTATDSDLIKRIKPLNRIPEKEIMLYALLNKLEVASDECPYAGENHRTKIRDFINTLESDQPGVKHKIISGWEKIIETSTPEKKPMHKCKICNHPSSRKICRSCELTEEIKIKRKDATKEVAD
ncbi:MAG TPA: TIGR00269 family protein [Euryarchaeota archaeon]|nr:TIGR00269 family protein [Euryarchaeota archaeon]